MPNREQGQTPETIERLYGPHTHVCWTPDYTPREQREQVVLVRIADLERLEHERNALRASLERVVSSWDAVRVAQGEISIATANRCGLEDAKTCLHNALDRQSTIDEQARAAITKAKG